MFFNHVVKKYCLWLQLFLPVLRPQSKALSLLADKNHMNLGDLTSFKQSLVFQMNTIKSMRAAASLWFYHVPFLRKMKNLVLVSLWLLRSYMMSLTVSI